MGELKRLFASRGFLAVCLIIIAGSCLLYLMEQWNGPVPSAAWQKEEDVFRTTLETLQNFPPEEAGERLEKLYKEEWNRPELDWENIGAFTRLREQIKSLEDWDAFLQKIEEDAERLKQFSIFQNSKEYTNRNILRTAEEYGKIKGISLSLGHDQAITGLLGFRAGDYLYVLWMLCLVWMFLQERRRSLWNMIYVAPNGRTLLALKRLVILAGAGAAGTILIYGGALTAGCLLYGTPELSRTVQSVPMLQTVAQPVTLGRFLLGYFLQRILAGFMLGSFFYAVIGRFRTLTAGILTAAAVIVAEYTIFWTVPLQSSGNIFLYANLASVIESGRIYEYYLNINLFSYPVSTHTIQLTFIVVMGVVCSAVCIVNQCLLRPGKGRNCLEQALQKLRSVTDAVWTRSPLWLQEIRKLVFLQKGWIPFILFLLLMLNTLFGAPIGSAADAQLADRFCSEHAGPVAEITRAAWNKWNETVTESFERKDLSAAEENGLQIQRSALEIVKGRIQLCEETGGWLVSETGFPRFFSKDAIRSYQVSSLLFLLLIVLTAGSISTFDSESRMRNNLRSTIHGRKALFRGKTIALFLLILTAAAIYTWTEYRQLVQVLDPAVWNTPTDSLPMLDIPWFKGTFGGFYLLLTGMRACFCAVLGGILLLISEKAMRTITAMAWEGLVLMVPSLIDMAGATMLRPLSSASVFGGWPMVLSGIGPAAIGLWFAAGIIVWLLLAARNKD